MINFRASKNIRAEDNIREYRKDFIQSQYSASPAIISLLEQLRQELYTWGEICEIYNNIINIETATGNGLDYWGNILQIDRNVSINNLSYTLNDDKYRTLLMYKALSNISDSSTKSINNNIALLYPSGDVPYCIPIITEGTTSGGLKYNSTPMETRWILPNTLSSLDLAIFKTVTNICRNAGVEYNINANDPINVFGFDGSNYQPFNQGIFRDE